MLQITAAKGFLYFVFYSVVGWLCETVYCSIGNRKPVNRGFLSGPYCPVYGFGGLLILVLAAPFDRNPFLVFVITLVACGVLEYVTGWLLETAFQTKWWDYSKRRFNIKGRVCALNLTMFGVMGLALVYLIHPRVRALLGGLSPFAEQLTASLLLVLIAADFIQTLAAITNLRDRLHRLQSLFDTLERYEAQHFWYDKRDIPGSIKRLRQICYQDAENEDAARILARLDKLTGDKGQGRRLMRAFPDARFKGLEQAVENLREKWNQAKKKRDKN